MLKEHNREAYEATKNMLLEHRECCLVAATGIGKSNVATELIQELGLNALVIAPKTSIRDEWSIMPDKYGIPPTFSTMTYQYFVRHYENLYGFDAYIFDEAHHAGAPKWGKAIRKFREGLDTEFVLGLTADPNRYNDRSKRDKENKIISSVVKTVFNDHGVYGHNQRSAIENGILPRATYVCSIYNADEMFDKYEAMDLTEELRGRLNYTRTNCETIEDTLRRNVPNGVPVKGIVFVDSISNIDIGVRLVRRAFPREAVHYIHSKLSAKENAETLEMFKKSKSGFIVSVDMIGEGLHIDGLNTVIMLRKTGSPSIYTQQIGRGLAAGSNDATIFDFVRNDTSIKKVLARIKNMSESYQNNKDEETDSEEDIADNSNCRTKHPKISDQFIVKDKAFDILEVFDAIENYFNGNKHQRWTEEEDNIIREYYPSMGAKVVSKIPGRTTSACIARAGVLNVRNCRNWTEEEDNILKEYYPSMGAKVYTKLPGRTGNACVARAKALNIRYTINNKNWSEEEDAILKEYYPSMGAKVYTKLPGRTGNACVTRARSISLEFDNRKIEWSEEEDAILKEYYPSMGAKVYTKLPGRTGNACVTRAGALNIKRQLNDWAEEEDNILKEYYPSMGAKVYTKLPGRTGNACVTRASILGVSVPQNFWTEEEDNIIREYYPSMGYMVYTKLPGRTKDACRGRAIILKVKMPSNNWTEEEDNIIREYYPSMGAKVVSKITGRGRSACINRALKLGVKYLKNDWSEEEDAILKEYYPSMGAKVRTKLPGRTAAACANRSRILGIKVPKPKTGWSEEEDAILKEYYPSMGSKVIIKLPERTKEACIARAKFLKIKVMR